MNDKFCNLHGHSVGSLLDGMTRPNELVDYTLKIGQPASCITDHGVMYSIVDHFQYAKAHDQKALAGFEAYVVKDHNIKDKSEAQSESDNKREHMVLLAKNNDGYKRLMKICSIGTTEGFYYRPRIDDKVLETIGTQGIIGTSACLAGRIDQCLLKDDIEGAEKWAIYYYKLFNGDFYLEIQPTKHQEQIKVNLGLIEIHKKTGIPIVATSDFHYLKREDAETHDLLLCMQSRSLLNDPNRWSFPGDTFFVMTRQEMTKLFNSNGHEILDQKVVELAMDTTVEIANKCNVSFEWGKHYLPKIEPESSNIEFNNWSKKRKSDGNVSADYLKYICIKGLKEKKKTSKEYRDRLDYELGVINDMGFPDYFLIFWDIMKYCRENNIPVGPARGSGGGSLVAYASGITTVDPLEYDLLFERFLNPSRGKLPDIDSDFCVKKGWMVFQYLIDKYGKEYTCNIATFGRLQPKAVIKDIGKAMGIPFEEVNEFTKGIADDIKHINEIIEDPQYSMFTNKYPQLFKHAAKLEGSPRHVSQHAAGICITPIPITDLLPVQNAKETDGNYEPGYLSQFEKEQTEQCGAVKMDILKLKNVTEIREQLELINKLYGKNLTEEDIPFDDEKAWDLIGNGDTLGIFQMASNVAIPVLRKVRPRNIEELSAVNAFIRPGASGLDEYLANKKQMSNKVRLDPRLDRHLDSTYGAIVYQEQIMFLISELMGISFGEADLYRRALEKPAKDKKGYVKKFNEEVVDIAISKGFDRNVADKVRQMIIDNCGYGFNKCLSGNERIFRQKNQFNFNPTIAEMYKIKNDREYAKSTGHLSLYKKYKNSYGEALSMDLEGRLHSNKIIDIYYSGVKSIYLVETEDGQTVKCTMNHSFPTPNGKKMLMELNVGSELYVLDSYESQKYNKLNIIRYKNIPKKGQRGFQKGGPIGTWFFNEYRTSKLGIKCELCENEGKELHHKDHNHDNNVEDNFQWLCISCHKKQHYKLGRTKRYGKGLLTKTSKIKSITYICDEEVYDIEMEAPNHNLLMENGIVVSNSHSVAYSFISYWTAWIKVNYPLVFYTTMFNGNLDQIPSFMEEAKKNGITIKPPHVCYSKYESIIEDESNKVIRIGLNAVKGIGPAAVDSIINSQPYTSMDDFFERNLLRAVNKRVIEAAIKVGGFDGLGIKIEKDDIKEEHKFAFKIEEDNLQTLAKLNRNQMWFWYEKVNEANSVKSIPNYAVPTSLIKGKYFDACELFIEKGEDIVIMPEDRLTDFSIKLEDVKDFKTRKRPKGVFKLTHEDNRKISAFRKPFVYYGQELSEIQENYLDIYLKETEEFGHSFLSHPLEPHMDKIMIYKEVEDGNMMITAGIITEMIERKTKTGKKMYWVIIQTPRDSVRVTLWDKDFKKYNKILKKHNLIIVKGMKGFGGMSTDTIKQINMK